MADKRTITVVIVIQTPIEKVWEFWTNPKHIVGWAFASDDWEAPAAENDVRVGGKFKIVMAAKDKSASFDFTGVYTNVKKRELIEYDIGEIKLGETRVDGGRHVKVEFAGVPADAKALAGQPDGVKITETFEPESINPEEMQRSGWQSILNNFKKYVEGNP